MAVTRITSEMVSWNYFFFSLIWVKNMWIQMVYKIVDWYSKQTHAIHLIHQKNANFRILNFNILFNIALQQRN